MTTYTATAQLSLANDTGPSSTDGITTDPTLTGHLIGSRGDLLELQVIIDQQLETTASVNEQGFWTYTPSGLADGVHTIYTRELHYLLKDRPLIYSVSTSFTLDTTADVHADAYVATSGHTIVMGANDGVLANDHAPGGGGAATTAALVAGTAHGSIDLAADGGFAYTPDPGFTGVDRFSYHASTESGAGGNADVMLYVAPVSVGTTTTLNLTALTAAEQVAATYAAFFGRIPDVDGFLFWVNQFSINQASQGPASLFANVASAFGVSNEAKNLYAFLAHPAGASDAEISTFLNGVYDNLFNRAPDTAGLAYWTGQIKQTLASGQFVGSVLINIMSGTQNTAEGHDITTLMSKVAVSLSYLADPGPIVPAASGATNAVLHAVTDAPQSVLVGIVDAHTIAVTGHL
ncbi:MAG: DUF4214 domain-containing protein [Reyranellaceae bacterium]